MKYRQSTPLFRLLIAGAAVLLLGADNCAEKRVHENYLGANYVDYPQDKSGLAGVLIVRVRACSPAQSAGLHVGDVITALGTARVSGDRFDEILNGFPEGSEITLTVSRNNKLLTLRADLAITDTGPQPRTAPNFGIGLWQPAVAHATVLCLYSGGPAERAGLKTGDQIVRIGDQAASSTNQNDLLTHFNAGDRVEVTVKRGDVSRIFVVETSDDDPPDERLEVSDVQLLDGDIERVIDVEEVPLNNCHGNSILESQRTFAKKMTRQVALNLSGELEVFGAAPFVLAQAKLAGKYEFNSTDELSESKTEIMRAAPGTSVMYIVTWFEVSSRGLVHLYANGKEHDIPFQVSKRLRVQTRASMSSPCPTSDDVPTSG